MKHRGHANQKPPCVQTAVVQRSPLGCCPAAYDSHTREEKVTVGPCEKQEAPLSLGSSQKGPRRPTPAGRSSFTAPLPSTEPIAHSSQSTEPGHSCARGPGLIHPHRTQRRRAGQVRSGEINNQSVNLFPLMQEITHTYTHIQGVKAPQDQLSSELSLRIDLQQLHSHHSPRQRAKVQQG